MKMVFPKLILERGKKKKTHITYILVLITQNLFLYLICNSLFPLNSLHIVFDIRTWLSFQFRKSNFNSILWSPLVRKPRTTIRFSHKNLRDTLSDISLSPHKSQVRLITWERFVGLREMRDWESCEAERNIMLRELWCERANWGQEFQREPHEVCAVSRLKKKERKNSWEKETWRRKRESHWWTLCCLTRVWQHLPVCPTNLWFTTIMSLNSVSIRLKTLKFCFQNSLFILIILSDVLYEN